MASPSPSPRRELDSLLAQARSDYGPAWIGKIAKKDGSVVAVLLADRSPWIFRTLTAKKADLAKYLGVSSVVVTDHFKDSRVEFAVRKLGAFVRFEEKS